jgi:2-hydroxy-3-keto-5-methylthiopentenyl-1-phosphate phosphatase
MTKILVEDAKLEEAIKKFLRLNKKNEEERSIVSSGKR